MGEGYERAEAQTEAPSSKKMQEFKELFPGVIIDGVLDAARLGEILDSEVAGLKDDKERFGLMWSGRKKAMEALQAESYAALVPDFDSSMGWETAENVFIEGDNLEVLKLLQNAYNDQIKMIYIDPPYNTGNDFVYNDDFSDPKRRYLEVTGQVDSDGNRLTSNTETSGRKHSNWLTMMYPRLVLARNLLTEDGSMFVSIDDNELHHLRSIMDEIFGPENFISILNWKKRGTGGQVANNALIDQTEYVLVYARDISQVVLSGISNPNAGSEKWRSFRKAGGQWQRRYRPNQHFPIYVDSELGVSLEESSDTTAVFPRDSNGEDGFWENGYETAKARCEMGQLRAREISGKIQIEQLEISGETSNAGNFIDIPSTRGANEIREIFGSIVFENPKPLDFLYYLIEIAGVRPGDTVMDFFAGSGSFGHAVTKRSKALKGNLRYLLVNLDENIKESTNAYAMGYRNVCELTVERLRYAANENKTSGGFRVFRLGRSKIRSVSASEEGLFEMSQVVDARGTVEQLELGYDLMLRQGVALGISNKTLPSENGNEIAIMSGGNVSIIFDPSSFIKNSQGLREASVLIFLEDSFKGKDSLKAQIAFDSRTAGKKMVTY